MRKYLERFVRQCNGKFAGIHQFVGAAAFVRLCVGEAHWEKNSLGEKLNVWEAALNQEEAHQEEAHQEESSMGKARMHIVLV